MSLEFSSFIPVVHVLNFQVKQNRVTVTLSCVITEKNSLREKCLNTEFFLVRIFLYSV